MGKGSSAPPPPDPQATARAEAQFNRVDVFSPSGSGQRFGYTDPTTGKFMRGLPPPDTQAQSAVQRIESPTEQRIREVLEPASAALVNRMIADNVIGLPQAPRVQDRSDVARDLFNRSFSMMAPGIEKSNERLLTNLQARGIPIGAQAFNDAYGEQQRQTQDMLSRLAMDANLAAGGEQSRQFSLDQGQRQNAIAEIVAAMGGAYNPPAAQPSGSAPLINYSGMVRDQFNAQQQQHAAAQQRAASTASTLGGLGAALITKSDRWAKRDIVPVGRCGVLAVFEYRYAWDKPGTRRRGYMAQQVAALFPHAVHRVGRWLAVDYAQLPEVAA